MDDNTREERRKIADTSIALAQLDGGRVSDYARHLMDRWVDGEITYEEQGALLEEYWKDRKKGEEMAKVVLEGRAVLTRTDAAPNNPYAATALGKAGWLEVRASERLYPGKHFAVFACAEGDLLRTTCGTLERPDENTVILRYTVRGHTYEFERCD